MAYGKEENREVWLFAAVQAMRPHFKAAGHELHDKLRVSCGFPPRGIEKVGGVCFKREASADGVNEIFITPMMDDAEQVLATLVHELIHAQDNCKSGHGKPFAALATTLGLVGKPTATTGSKEFELRYARELSKLGEYPHATLRYTKIKKQGTRLLKVECEGCGYIARVTKTWIDMMGAPICPGCREQMKAEAAE